MADVRRGEDLTMSGTRILETAVLILALIVGLKLGQKLVQ